MKVEIQTGIWAGVDAAVGRLFGELMMLLRDEIRDRASEKGLFDGPIEGLEKAAEGLAAKALYRFLKAVLDGEAEFFSRTGKIPVALGARLLGRWAERIRPKAETAYASALDGFRSRFPEIRIVDAAPVAELLRESALRAVGGVDGGGGLDGWITAVYDPLRGIVERIAFDPQADVNGDGPCPSHIEGIGKDALVLGICESDPGSLIEAIIRCGAHGVIRVPGVPGGEQEHVRDRTSEDATTSDAETNLLAPGGALKVRRIKAGGTAAGWTVLTDILDRDLLPAADALRLAPRRWRVRHLFSGLESILDSRRINLQGPRAIEAQLQFAALLDAALRVAQGWIARTLGQGASSLSVENLFPAIARALTIKAARAAGSTNGTSDKPASRWPIEDRLKIRMFPVPGEGTGLEGHADGTGGGRPIPASRDEMMAIGRIAVEPAFAPFCEGYAKVGHRNGFLWRWVQMGINLTALPSIDPAWSAKNRTSKLLGVMLDVLLDDVADNAQFKDQELLEALLAIPFDRKHGEPPLRSGKQPYHRFAAEVWAEIDGLARSFPRYEEFRNVFEFDYHQLLNTMRYAFLVNLMPEILNPVEHDLYQPHNMHMMISGTLDLMCSPGFDRSELCMVRQALWRGQVMGRIGNMVSTWEREIGEKDFTSGVFAAAIARGVVGVTEMPRMDPRDLTAAIEESGVIEHFLREWERLRDEVYQIARKVRSVDLIRYAAGLEQLIRNHLGSRGLK